MKLFLQRHDCKRCSVEGACWHQPAFCDGIGSITHWWFFGGSIQLIFLYDVVLFVHKKCVADGGTTGELKVLLWEKFGTKLICGIKAV